MSKTLGPFDFNKTFGSRDMSKYVGSFDFSKKFGSGNMSKPLLGSFAEIGSRDMSKYLLGSFNFSKTFGLLDTDTLKNFGFENYKNQMISLADKAIENKFWFDKILEGIDTQSISEDFKMDDNGNITINEILYDSSEVSNAFIALDETLSSEIGIEQSISKLFRNYSIKHPVIAWILNRIILTIIISLFLSKVHSTPSVIQNYNININTINPQYSITTIAKQVKPSLVEQTLIDNYKFVSIKSLNVYNSKSSVQFIGELKFGQVVSVLEKRRKWAIIETFGLDNKYIMGWARIKYLK